MINDTSIKNDTNILVGSNIRKYREMIGMKPGRLVRELHLKGVEITIFGLSKIEANTQHIKASQLKAIKEVLNCSYDDLLESQSDEE